MRKCHCKTQPILTLPQPNKDFADERSCRFSQLFTAETHDIFGLIEQDVLQERVGGAPQSGIVLGGLFRELAEMLANSWIEFLFQVGQQFVTQAISSQRDVLIGCVLSEVLAEFGEKLFDIGSPNGKHWPNEPLRSRNRCRIIQAA